MGGSDSGGRRGERDFSPPSFVRATRADESNHFHWPTDRAELLQKSDATKKSLGLGGGIGVPGVKNRNFNEKSKNVLDASLIKKSGTGAFFKSPTSMIFIRNTRSAR